MFDAIKFYEQYKIEHVTSGHKHCRPGWVQVECPFCVGNPGFHLGYCYDPKNSFAGNFACWRCGGKNPIKVISALTQKSLEDSRLIFLKFKGVSTGPRVSRDRLVIPARPKRVQMVEGALALRDCPRAIDYLRKREHSPRELESTWGVFATGPFGDYRFRVMVPITLKSIPVSYQGRDYTGKSEIKYQTCSKADETVHHKDIVGGYDQAVARGSSTVILVEGFFDSFRLGPGACPLFGIKYRMPQVRFVAEHWKRAGVVFDGGERQARRQSEKICTELAQRGLEVFEILLENGDPDSAFTTQEARQLMYNWLK